MGNEDDGDALGLEVVDLFKKVVGFVLGEGGRWFVEDKSLSE